MSKSARNTLFVATFLLGVLGLGTLVAWTLWPSVAHLPDYDWQATALSNYRPGGAACEPAALLKLDGERARTDKQQSCDAEAEQHRLQTNDLKQQTRAADAATAAVWIAEWQAKATVLGLVIGLYTLGAAAAAALFAKRAADETKRSADEAAKGVKAAQDAAGAAHATYMSYIVNERGILKLKGASHYRDRDSAWPDRVAIDVKNQGRGNATILYTCWSVLDGPIFPEKCRYTDYSSQFIQAGETELVRHCALDQIDEVEPVWLMGFIEYKTLVDITARTHFCYKIVWHPDDGYTAGRLVFEPSICQNLPMDT